MTKVSTTLHRSNVVETRCGSAPISFYCIFSCNAERLHRCVVDDVYRGCRRALTPLSFSSSLSLSLFSNSRKIIIWVFEDLLSVTATSMICHRRRSEYRWTSADGASAWCGGPAHFHFLSCSSMFFNVQCCSFPFFHFFHFLPFSSNFAVEFSLNFFRFLSFSFSLFVFHYLSF